MFQALSPATFLAHTTSMSMTDMQQAATIYTEIESNAQKSQMQRWKILEDTQTKIFEMQQEMTLNRAKSQDKLYNKWDEYIRG